MVKRDLSYLCGSSATFYGTACKDNMCAMLYRCFSKSPSNAGVTPSNYT